MKRKRDIMIFTGTILLCLSGFSCCVGGYNELQDYRMQEPDLSILSDGDYRGSYNYSRDPGPLSFSSTVDVKIKDGTFETIEIDKSRTGERVLAASGIIDEMVRENRVLVDVISGATISSKAIQAAVINAVLPQ